MARILWLPEVLKAAGLPVALVPGWETRGSDPPGPMLGVVAHHTASRARGNMPSLGVIRDGRPDLKGPLSQLALGRDGTWYVIGSGRANHAGRGTWNGCNNGNAQMIGVEAENAGTAVEPWPEIQLDSYARGVAALLGKLGRDPSWCCGHKEYALPRGRKIDPSFDMSAFRRRVSEIMGGAVPPRVQIPIVAPSGRPTLRRGSADKDSVMALSVLLGVRPQDRVMSVFDADLEARVRQFQRDHGLVPDGVVGPKTWAALDAG